MQNIKIVIGRCVHKGEPIICAGLCNTVSCPLPLWRAIGMPKPQEGHPIVTAQQVVSEMLNEDGYIDPLHLGC